MNEIDNIIPSVIEESDKVIQLTPELFQEILKKVVDNTEKASPPVNQIVENSNGDLQTILLYIFFALCFICGAILVSSFIKGWNSKV